MRCTKCKGGFEEFQLDESHDIPCYLFIKHGNRKGQKNQADKFGRHWLCKKCHQEYEDGLNLSLKIHAKQFCNKFFKEEENDANS